MDGESGVGAVEQRGRVRRFTQNRQGERQETAVYCGTLFGVWKTVRRVEGARLRFAAPGVERSEGWAV